MAATFTLQVVTVTESLFDGEAISLHCKGVDGELTVLSQHEPLITKVEESTIKVKTAENEELEFPVAGGVLEVANNKAVVLCSLGGQKI